MLYINNPTVTVVIPTYNRPGFLVKALQSVLEQTYNDLEIIIVDDNSEYSTSDFVLSLKDHRIKYIKHEKNRGGSAARNTGIELANGKYIAFLDDDDTWLRNRVSSGLIHMEKFDGSLCRSLINGRIKSSAYKKPIVEQNDLRKGYIFTGGSSIIMLKSSIAKKLMFDEALPCGQDWDFLVRLCGKYKIAYTRDALVNYNDGPHARINNATANMPIDQLEHRLKVLYKHEDFLGPFWLKYRISFRLLSHISSRREKLKYMHQIILRCGWFPILLAIWNKLTQKALRSHFMFF